MTPFDKYLHLNKYGTYVCILTLDRVGILLDNIQIGINHIDYKTDSYVNKV